MAQRQSPLGSGGRHVTADRYESSPYAAMKSAVATADVAKTKGINALHIRVRAVGGVGPRIPGPGAQDCIRVLPEPDFESVELTMSPLYLMIPLVNLGGEEAVECSGQFP